MAWNGGYIERKSNGEYVGDLSIEGVDISKIDAVLFKDNGDTYLWLKRRPALVYDTNTQTYKKRERQPRWECYLKKCLHDDSVAFEGTFTFLRFRYSIKGVWDSVMGMDKSYRLNLYVERLPNSEQTIINNINERKRNASAK